MIQFNSGNFNNDRINRITMQKQVFNRRSEYNQ